MTRLRRVTQRQFVQAVFVSTEVAPWSKSGGLGDVLQALPVALARRGLACMTVAPLYKPYSGTTPLNLAVPVSINSASPPSKKINNSLHVVRLHVLVDKGVARVFVEHPYFAVSEGGIYSSYTVDGKERDVPAAMDVLCQASLAASLLVPAHADQLCGWVGGPLASNITVRFQYLSTLEASAQQHHHSHFQPQGSCRVMREKSRTILGMSKQSLLPMTGLLQSFPCTCSPSKQSPGLKALPQRSRNL